MSLERLHVNTACCKNSFVAGSMDDLPAYSFLVKDILKDTEVVLSRTSMQPLEKSKFSCV